MADLHAALASAASRLAARGKGILAADEPPDIMVTLQSLIAHLFISLLGLLLGFIIIIIIIIIIIFFFFFLLLFLSGRSL